MPTGTVLHKCGRPRGRKSRGQESMEQWGIDVAAEGNDSRLRSILVQESFQTGVTKLMICPSRVK